MRTEADQAQLQAAVDRQYHPVYMSKKSEIIEHYKDKYGAKGWTRAIAEALHGSIKNSKGEDASVKSIMRRFQGSRVEKGEGRSSAMYKELGQKLPSTGKKLDGNELKITVKGTRPDGRAMSHTVVFKGTAAVEFADNPAYGDIWEDYMGDYDTFDSDEYGIEITGVY